MAISAVNNNISFKGIADMTPEKAQELINVVRDDDFYSKDTVEFSEQNPKQRDKNILEAALSIVSAFGLFLAVGRLGVGAVTKFVPSSSEKLGKLAQKASDAVTPAVEKGINALKTSSKLPKKTGEIAENAAKFVGKKLTGGIAGEEGMIKAGKNLASIPIATLAFAKVASTDGDGNGKKDILEIGQNAYANTIKASAALDTIVSILA